MPGVPFICPRSGLDLSYDGKFLKSSNNESYPIVNGIPRFCPKENYSDSFGFQWNYFDKDQLDNYSGSRVTQDRFYAETAWDPKELNNQNILEVGSGAGRFTEVFLRTTSTNLYSIDYSDAVDANWRNNNSYGSRLILAQASMYEMPFPDNSFDKIFCLGVLQHTPSFKDSITSLIKKLKPGGELVVDFYPIKGFYTKIHSKYILRPLTKRLPKKLLLNLIESNIDFLIFISDLLCFIKLGFLIRFVPITDIRYFPKDLSPKQRRKWAIMDTFDAFSPEYDNPQRLRDVVQMCKSNNCKVIFSGKVGYSNGSATVVRSIKKY